MLEVKQYNEIKKGIRYIPFDVNTNSKLYINGLELTKVPKRHIMYGSKEEKLLKYIYEKDMKCCTKVKRLIYKENRLAGYTITFYKEHKSLRKLLRKNIGLKKQDCLKIEQAFNELSKNHLEFIDYNLSNILIDENNDVKICDLESLIINEDEDLSIINNESLFIMTLSYLYNLHENEVCALVRNRAQFSIFKSKEIMELFDKLNNGENVKIEELLSLITDEDVKIKRMALKHNADCLKDSGYYRRYF